MLKSYKMAVLCFCPLARGPYKIYLGHHGNKFELKDSSKMANNQNGVS